MDLNLWRVFYEVANIKNISKTSEKLHISQPAITKQIKNLEEYLNCKLFIRTQKGVVLTKDAEKILNDINQGLHSFALAEKKIKADNMLMSGTIRIGIGATLTKVFLMQYIRKFHKKYPNIIFEIHTDPTHVLKDKLKSGNLDFIIAKFPLKKKDEFEYTCIGSMQDIFVVNKDYKELLKKPLYITNIEKYPILLQKQPSSSRDFIENHCQKYGLELTSIMEIASARLLIEFTKVGYGIGVVTKEYVEKELERKEIFELSVTPSIPKRDFGLISLKQNYLSKCSREFLKMILKANKKKEESSKKVSFEKKSML